MYSTLQAAHNAAASGDIIYMEGSGVQYAGATITKRLTIIGPVYFLGENYNTFPDLRPAEFVTFADLVFDIGSDGSILSGCSNIEVTIKVSNVTISRNKDLTVYLTGNIPLTGILISKNYSIRPYNSFSKGANITIANNFISSTYGLNSSEISGTFINNIVVGGISLENFNVSNNIWVSGSGSATSFTNCTFSNNIDARALVNSNAFGTTNGNQANVDKATLFVGTTGNSTDGQWKLKAGSPAIGAGFGGIDCGMFGGLDPYALSGIVAADYPTITSFTTSGAGNSTTPLTVKISTKSN
ncbi:MAG: hypothetical protein J0L66_11630 [Cytophagales bacterium]|nr:hypothetical protein [Cytophagales bacterium]